MIGNDIIDLSIVKNQGKAEDQRYLDKVFSEREQDIITNSFEKDLSLWILWSMKETAYKAHQRNFQLPRRINPISYACYYETGEKKGKVEIEDQNYSIELEITTEYIHCFTTSENLYRSISTGMNLKPEDFIQNMPDQSLISEGQFSIHKNQNGVPSIITENSGKIFPFSLSHHGNFTAFVIPLINS